MVQATFTSVLQRWSNWSNPTYLINPLSPTPCPYPAGLINPPCPLFFIMSRYLVLSPCERPKVQTNQLIRNNITYTASTTYLCMILQSDLHIFTNELSGELRSILLFQRHLPASLTRLDDLVVFYRRKANHQSRYFHGKSIKEGNIRLWNNSQLSSVES